jgi:hypothetical protein
MDRSMNQVLNGRIHRQHKEHHGTDKRYGGDLFGFPFLFPLLIAGHMFV